MSNPQFFIDALTRQVERKKLLLDGVSNMSQPPLKLLASITEEAGEVATELARQRWYAAIAECVDVAHSAMLLAMSLDPSGEVLSRLGHDK